MQITLYYGDIFFILGFLILYKIFKELRRLPEERLEVYGGEVVNLTETYDMKRRNIYPKVMGIAYMAPFVVWIVIMMYVNSFELANMSDYFLIFTAVSMIIGLVSKIQGIYMGRNWVYDMITYTTLGIFFIILGARSQLFEWIGLHNALGLPTESEAAVQPEIYFAMVLSLSLVLFVSLSIVFHDILLSKNNRFET